MKRKRRQCLKDFFRLSGRTPLLPRYALRNWWSRFYPYTEKSYHALLERFQKEQVPFSVAVLDMDWHVTNIAPKYGSGWTGYTWNREYFLEYPVSFQGGYQAAMEIMQTKCDVTAIFAIADIMAIGMLKAFRENGREVPQDYSIIGFDDIQFDEYVTPGLTTMHQDRAQKGKISAEIILEDVKHGCSKGKTVVLKPTLVERESVRQW